MENKKLIKIIYSELPSIEGELVGLHHAIKMTKGDIVWEELAKALLEMSKKLNRIQKQLLEEQK